MMTGVVLLCSIINIVLCLLVKKFAKESHMKVLDSLKEYEKKIIKDNKETVELIMGLYKIPKNKTTKKIKQKIT